MRKRGLQLKLRQRTVAEKAQAGRAARNRTAMVLSDDVFYGRAIVKIPRDALLSVESPIVDVELRKELTKLLFEERTLARDYNVSGEEATHLLSLAYPLIAENRDASSVFREWLDAVQDELLPALELTERQRSALKGTTAEGAFQEMSRLRDLILDTAPNVTYFRGKAVTQAEAKWALAVIMRHARVVHPHQDVRESRDPRMYLFPLRELLGVQLHPDASVGISFQEEIISEGKREEEMVLQIARRDMAKGEEVFLWPGRLANSDMVMRHGFAFAENPVGIGLNVSQPPNWTPNKESNVRKEYDKYNCSSLEAFELRLSPRGLPMRTYVKCFRISWFFTNGWYSPALQKRIRELHKWPPPKKYTKEDWLSWTQADQELNRVILEYCKQMRQQLKDTMDATTAEIFRRSKDPMDKLLWHLRGEESRSFKECVTVHKAIAAS
mmetsp:Transcript_96793/g.166898  ORF Transcript_96793/g.166898 Transcript_96793/m.166898 type:complete len:440 (-) Transcript_96793:73-1392(-)